MIFISIFQKNMTPKKIGPFLLGALIFLFFDCRAQDSETIQITGLVTDYSGNPQDSVFVVAMNKNFSPNASTFTDADGQYHLELQKGKFMALLAVRMHEYPRFSSLPAKEQRLEYWAWNFIADKDTVINIKYHRLEIYGLNVFKIHGASPGYTIYCRPMSLTRLQNEMTDIAPDPDELEITVEINGKPVSVNMAQKVNEFIEEGELYGYLLHVDFKADLDKSRYDVFRIYMKDTTTGDKGEAIYFLEKSDYY